MFARLSDVHFRLIFPWEYTELKKIELLYSKSAKTISSEFVDSTGEHDRQTWENLLVCRRDFFFSKRLPLGNRQKPQRKPFAVIDGCPFPCTTKSRAPYCPTHGLHATSLQHAGGHFGSFLFVLEGTSLAESALQCDAGASHVLEASRLLFASKILKRLKWKFVVWNDVSSMFGGEKVLLCCHSGQKLQSFDSMCGSSMVFLAYEWLTN